jgi:hypothetical protein
MVARSRGRQTAASRHESTLERERAAFICCNGGFDSKRDLPRLPPRSADEAANGSDANAR